MNSVRQYSDDFKRVIVDKLIAGEASSVEIGRELKLPPHLLRRWFREAKERSVTDARALAAKLPRKKSGPYRQGFTEADKTKVIADLRASGLAVSVFAPTVELTEQTIRRWIREQRAAQEPAPPPERMPTEAELLPYREPVFLIERQQGNTEVETMTTVKAKVFTPEMRAAAVKKVKEAGGTVTLALAEEIGASTATVRDWMKHGTQSKTRRQFDEKTKTAILARVAAGENLEKLSKEVGIVRSVIQRWADNAKIKVKNVRSLPKSKGVTKGFRYDNEIKRKALELMDKLQDANAVAEKTKVPVGTIYKWLRAARADAPAKANAHPAPKSNGEGWHVKHAITYLKHATAAIQDDLTQGRIKELSRAHLLTQLALKELLGE